jgi:hypothetical protein
MIDSPQKVVVAEVFEVVVEAVEPGQRERRVGVQPWEM